MSGKFGKGKALDSLINIFEGAVGGYIANKLSKDDKDDEEDVNQQINGYLSKESEDDDSENEADTNPYAALESLEQLLDDELDEYGDDASNLCNSYDDLDADD